MKIKKKKWYYCVRSVFVLFSLMVYANLFAGEKYKNETYKLEMIKSPIVSYGDSLDQYMIIIENISDQNIWIFMEDSNSLEDKDMIRQRFKDRQDGDMSLFQWMVDGNVNWERYIPELYSTFFKILPPEETFTLISIDKPLFGLLMDKLRIISMDEMSGIFKSLSILPPDIEPSYQPNVVYIP